jgi:hypothetical protein
VKKYERLAVDGQGDAWGYREGQWWCMFGDGGADDDAGLEARYPPVTFYLLPAPLGRGQLGTALSALEDAAAYRREYQDGDCADCYGLDGLSMGVLCGDHACDEAMASMYDLLHEELQEQQVTGPVGVGDAATVEAEPRKAQGLVPGTTARHPRVTWVNAINGQNRSRCFPDPAAAYDAAVSERPFNNTRVSPGWCTEVHTEVHDDEG